MHIIWTLLIRDGKRNWETGAKYFDMLPMMIFFLVLSLWVKSNDKPVLLLLLLTPLQDADDVTGCSRFNMTYNVNH